MRALVCEKIGSIDDLVVREVEAPRAGPGQVVIDVKAAGVNFPDVLVVQGLYQPRLNPSFTVKGTVVVLHPLELSSGLIGSRGEQIATHELGELIEHSVGRQRLRDIEDRRVRAGLEHVAEKEQAPFAIAERTKLRRVLGEERIEENGEPCPQQLEERTFPRDVDVGQAYNLTGPRLVTFAEAVAAIARASGRAVRYVPVSVDDYVRALSEHIPATEAELVGSICRETLDGHNAFVEDGVRRALGRAPRDFDDFVRDAARAGAWA